MPTFVHPALLWGLPLVGMVVLIHLINMLRHRRVEWAAMEFLRQSQKKNRTWIILRQLLLLLLRMVVIAVVVLMLAGPVLRNQIGALFGRTTTHHVVLLDDSFSMSDRLADHNALDDAKQVVERIGTEAARQIHPQSFTLLRFSRAAGFDRPMRPDLLEAPVGGDFPTELGDLLTKIDTSETAAGPSPSLRRIGPLLAKSRDERQIVYLISDFRAREWNDPTDLHRQLSELQQAGADIRLVNCVEASRPNLAITRLLPASGIRAAGVPWFMEVTVRNFGNAPVREVAVQLVENGHARPAVTIPQIPAGRAVTGQFLVHFPTAGRHRLTARLENDAVAADNLRFAAVDVPADVPVLIVDGAAAARDGRYLAVAAAPGGPVRTGIRPRIETPRYLSLHPLEQFAAVNLVNVERLDPSAVKALEQYAAAGGGVAWFLGENCSSLFYNDQLYRNGEGLFPVPIVGQEELPVDRLENTPDLQVEDHYVFRVFRGKRNSFLDTVRVARYFAVPEPWRPAADSTTRVIARLRGGAPLAVERRFGQGRVVAFLTSAAPVWNNWARNPSFVVAVQDLQAYLAGRNGDDVSRQVAAKLELSLDPAEYRPQVRFVPPGDDATSTASIDAVPTADGSLAVAFSETDQSGFYEAVLTKTDGSQQQRHFALNVDATEGDLKTLSGEDLAARLDGIDYDYRQAADFRYSLGEQAGYNLSDWLLYLLVVLLIGEQIVAWWASYHPPARSVATAPGGVR